MSLITVHYRDINRPQHDVKTVPVHQPKGKPFNLQKYVTHLPMQPRPYYFNSITKLASSFGDKPQDVVIMIKPYLRARLLFEDVTKHNQIVADHSLYARENGHSLNYLKIGQDYMPKGFRFLNPKSASVKSSNDHHFQHGATEIIYIQPKVHQKPVHQPSKSQNKAVHAKPNKSSRLVKGTIQYLDAKTNRILKTVPVSGQRDQKIDYKKYRSAKYLPNHYQFDHVSVNVGHFLEPHARYTIVVKPLPKRPASVSADVLYQDAKSHQIKKTVIMHGQPGQSTSAYTDQHSKYLPQGYHYVKLLSNHGTHLQKNAIYIVLIANNVNNAKSHQTTPHRSTTAHHQTGSHLNQNQANANHSFHQSSAKGQSAQNVKHDVRHFTQLPQINGNDKHDIGAILVALGASLNALGHAISRNNK